MDLLKEAKRGNKKAFQEIAIPIEIKLYKTARLYFKQEPEVLKAVKFSLNKLYKEIKSIKTEEDIIVYALAILIKYSNQKVSEYSRSKTWNKKYNTEKYKLEYDLYRVDSTLEQYITSMRPEHRLISTLYFYDGLSIKNISKIIRKNEKNVERIVDLAREEMVELIINEGVKKYNDYV